MNGTATCEAISGQFEEQASKSSIPKRRATPIQMARHNKGDFHKRNDKFQGLFQQKHVET